MFGAVTLASVVYAIGGSRLLGALSWFDAAIELGAGCLLLRADCLEWFRKQLS